MTRGWPTRPSVLMVMSMFALQGRRILITGAGSGIGAAIARRFAQAQARLILVDRDAAGLAAVAADCGPLVMTQVVDLGDAAGCRLAADACTAFGGCDVLVANAGIGHVGTIFQTTEADLDRLWTINVKSVFHLVQALLPGMLAQQRGSVIVTASIGAVVGIRDRVAYCTTKSALAGLVKCLALDHATSGVRFNALCPGRVETPFVSQRLAESTDPLAARAAMTATQALGRMGTPEEIAAAAHYLASDEAAFVTGSEFIIDGGWTAGK